MVRFAMKIDHFARYVQNIVFMPGISKWWPNWAKLRIETEKIKMNGIRVEVIFKISKRKVFNNAAWLNPWAMGNGLHKFSPKRTF